MQRRALSCDAARRISRTRSIRAGPAALGLYAPRGATVIPIERECDFRARVVVPLIGRLRTVSREPRAFRPGMSPCAPSCIAPTVNVFGAGVDIARVYVEYARSAEEVKE